MTIKGPSLITNKDVVQLLKSVAAAYIIREENRFRIIAYENAADVVDHMSREIRDIWQEGNLDKIKGIGASIASHLDEYFRKGYSPYFKEVFEGISPATFELMKIPSLGPKKAYKLASKFKLKNPLTAVEDLEKIALADRIAELPTFGKKSQDAILHAIGIYKKRSIKRDRMPLPYAFSLGQEIATYMKKHPGVKRVDLLGSLRRMVTTIGDIDMAVSASDKDASGVLEYFLKWPGIFSVDNRGEKKASIITTSQIKVDLRIQDEESYGSMLQYFTGGKDHNVKLREYAIKKGYSLNEYGIKNLNVKHPAPNIRKFADEESFYRFLGLDTPAPEIREARGEIDAARLKKLPKLIETPDIKGDLHLHSSYEMPITHDFGKNSYLEIAEKAKQLGYEYIGFSDHNLKADITEKQSVLILKKRKEDIDKTMSKAGIGYFIGMEVDILPDGNLALHEEAWNYLDYAIVSIHSVFNMDLKQQTKRVLTALSHPKVKILAHPTGRLLGRREGYELEWQEIFKKCKDSGIAVEINSSPERLDLPDSLVYEARLLGVRFVTNTDAHINSEMDNMFYGVSVARRGWCEKHDIINSLPYGQFKNWLIG